MPRHATYSELLDAYLIYEIFDNSFPGIFLLSAWIEDSDMLLQARSEAQSASLGGLGRKLGERRNDHIPFGR